MGKITIDDVGIQIDPMDVHSVRRPVSQPAGVTDFAMDYFELEPGESFSGGRHTHHDQEEVVYVQEGTPTSRSSASPSVRPNRDTTGSRSSRCSIAGSVMTRSATTSSSPTTGPFG